MKNRLIAFFLCLIAAFSLSSCCLPDFSALFGNKGETDTAGYVTVVLAPEDGEPQEYRADLSQVSGGAGLLSVLDALGIEYVENGGFITSVGDVKEDASRGVYVVLYTTAEADKDPSGWLEDRTYGEFTLSPSLVGAKDMTVKDGTVLYVGTVVYGW